MGRSLLRFGLLMSAFLTLYACSTEQVTESPPAPQANALLIGVSPVYPPVVFKVDKQISGVEPDLARLLGEELGRPIEFVELNWEDQISALLAGKTDMIMSGMTITDERRVRINFADPYLKIGLMAAIRAEDADKYDSLESMMMTYENVGVIPGTTGDVFVQRGFPHARRMAVSSARYAALELKRRRIDIFVYDGPAIAWLVSENEADLAGVWEPFNTEYLAWGVRRDDQLLLQSANGILRKWKQDGTLKQVLERWLPYLDLLDEPIP